MIIFFDTETTGIHPGNICQLSYILAKEGHVKAKNFFFKVDYISPAAVKVHGFTKEILEKLSGGKRFKDFSEEIYNDFKEADVLVGHNISFDNKFLKTELERSGKQFEPKDSFCTMWHFKQFLTKRPRLTELGAYLRIDSDAIERTSETLFGSGDNKAHDARYDTTLTYLCWRKGLEMEKISKGRFGILNKEAYLNPKFIESCQREELNLTKKKEIQKAIPKNATIPKKQLLQFPL
jgi:DNA polymerase III subunit epsilon